MNNDDSFSRQSFLGVDAQERISRCTVGVCGLGGGGSHIVQQLAHIGFLNYVLFDRDRIEKSNLNRLVGGTQQDVLDRTLKIDIARRLILGIRPGANVEIFPTFWQDNSTALKKCDLVLGCVDGLDERSQLEAACRSHLIPLIDIGMDVRRNDTGYSVAGQVILSMPGCACMRCMNFLDDESLAKEAAAYGAAGANPQVVWTNGMLSSAAIGLAVDMVTGWSKSLRKSIYLSHRGAAMTLSSDPIAAFAPETCTHYPITEVGPPLFRPL
jgi:molybdopterin-synthase adenylyltransferase